MTAIANTVLVMNAVNRLHDSIKAFNNQTKKQNERMLQLSWVIAVLTLTMTIAVGVQIYLAVKFQPTQIFPTSVSTISAQPTNSHDIGTVDGKLQR